MNFTKQSVLLISLVALVLLLFVLSISIGSVHLSFSEIWNGLNGNRGANPAFAYIIEGRLSRSVVALLAGAALGVAGLILQVFFRNPLAGPGVLGISSGAGLGVAFVVLGGFTLQGFSGYTLTIIAGVLGAVLVLSLLLAVSKFIQQMVTLLVIGLMLSYFSSAILNVLYQWADAEATRQYVKWGLGSYEDILGSKLLLFSFTILVALAGSFFLSKPLNALALGSNYASSLGVNIKKVKWQIIAITGTLTAVVTVFCGPIGFLGMAVPQFTRQISKNQNHVFLIPITILIGAIFSLVADIFVRLFNGGVPLNTATSLIGAPIVIWVIFKLNKRRF